MQRRWWYTARSQCVCAVSREVSEGEYVKGEEITYVHSILQSGRGMVSTPRDTTTERRTGTQILLHYCTTVPWEKLSSSSASSIFTPGSTSSGFAFTTIFSVS